MHISFVILHYLTERDTIECIDSILDNVDYNNYSIIVVDNGSTNGTGEALKLRYQVNEKVEIIISKQNLGFANGNNIGFIEAKKKYKADFIVLLNNDTIIKQQNIINIIIDKYISNSYAVLGPDIISTIDQQHQNPQPLRIKSKSNALFQLFRHVTLLILNYINIEFLVKKFLKKIKKAKKSNNIPVGDRINVQLHGSALIFSPLFIQRFDGLFNKTFMYFEEDILFYLCRKDHLKTLYSPDLKVYHKEDSATNEYLKNDNIKNRFIYKHSIKSIYQLLKIMK